MAAEVSGHYGSAATTVSLSLLAAVLTQLGDTLATIATQRSICEESAEACASK